MGEGLRRANSDLDFGDATNHEPALSKFDFKKLFEMIDILSEFGVPFMHDDLPQQLAAVRKLARKA